MPEPLHLSAGLYAAAARNRQPRALHRDRSPEPVEPPCASRERGAAAPTGVRHT